MSIDREVHWSQVYATKADEKLSWYQDNPILSLKLIEESGIGKHASVIDVGSGTSTLAHCLIERGVGTITVLDIAPEALDRGKSSLGDSSAQVKWVQADITSWAPPKHAFDLWHDRAVFHFLTESSDQTAYIRCLNAGLKVGGYAIIATFARDGPDTCSSLPIVKYDPEELALLLGPELRLIRYEFDLHETPWGSSQSFQYSLFQKVN